MKQVVITGIGVVSPNGIGQKAFKEALLAGKSGVKRISVFDANKAVSQVAGEVYLNGVSFSVKEQKNLPRVAQLAIIASEEALQTAGIDAQKLTEDERDRFGVILGTGGGSVEFMEKHYEIFYGQRESSPSVYVVSASTPGGLSSELSIRFGLKAKSHVITTGCSSSSDALGYAFHEIQSGRLTQALAGGADAPIAEGVLYGFAIMKVVSKNWNGEPERASRPFAKDRDGFVLAEGSWMFILEEKEHALARGAKIYAEIMGYGSSCEAFHAVRLDEEAEGDFRAMKQAFEESGLTPDQIDYVNLHGTSTQLNDRIETKSMKKAFGERAYKIPMSSTKSMIGHPQGASGSAAVAASLLCMQDNMIHPTINLEDPDPECDLDYVAQTARKKEVKYILCNTMGFGSKCSVLIFKNPAAK